MDWSKTRALTFDCYGTLIDWETGILSAVRPILARHGVEAADDRVLERFAHHEAALEAGAYRPYRRVLEGVLRGLGEDFGFDPAATGDATALADSVGDWPPFPDTVEALAGLAAHYRLGILSNIDDDLFAGSARRLGVDFDWVVTAQQVESYKPSERNFRVLLQRVGLGPDRLVHAAQSLFHDVRPASALGLSTVWVDRRAGRDGAGATPPADATPDLRVETLAELAEIACRDRGARS